MPILRSCTVLAMLGAAHTLRDSIWVHVLLPIVPHMVPEMKGKMWTSCFSCNFSNLPLMLPALSQMESREGGQTEKEEMSEDHGQCNPSALLQSITVSSSRRQVSYFRHRCTQRAFISANRIKPEQMEQPPQPCQPRLLELASQNGL